MGSQHVSLTINDDGLVTSVGNQESNDIYETCVLCGNKTDVKITTHIDYRYGYVEGSGQCCKECYDRTNKPKDDYVSNVMMRRLQLITISAEDIFNTPNDAELGAKLRQIYYSQFNVTPPKMTCSLCGQDTSEIDYDYLSGHDHISCILATEMKG